MEMVGFSIRISKEKRLKLEELASINYRTLNGEINKALDFYIKYGQGEPVINYSEPVKVDDELVRLKDVHIEPVKIEEVLNTNNFGNDEIDEF